VPEEEGKDGSGGGYSMQLSILTLALPLLCGLSIIEEIIFA
jgi:hypothetical protein